MAEYTKNLHLEKPVGSENFKRQIINNNMDLIDEDVEKRISKELATAEDQVLVSSGIGAWIVKTLAQFKEWLGLGSAAYTESTDYETPEGAQTKVAAAVEESVYLQSEEPENTNTKTIWFHVNGTVNFNDGGVMIENAQTSDTPPESYYWFDPID